MFHSSLFFTIIISDPGNESSMQYGSARKVHSISEDDLCSQCFHLPCKCQQINVILPNEMCLEDYIKHFNNPASQQTTQEKNVKRKLHYDPFELPQKIPRATSAVCESSHETPSLTFSKHLLVKKNIPQKI